MRACPRIAIAVALLLGGLAIAAEAPAAQTVYRCGNAYSNLPCPQAAVVDVDDARSPGQHEEARTVAAREAALASRMTADRERAESVAARQQPNRTVRARAPGLSASAPVRAVKRHHLPLRDNGQGDFVAVVPRPAKK